MNGLFLTVYLVAGAPAAPNEAMLREALSQLADVPAMQARLEFTKVYRRFDLQDSDTGPEWALRDERHFRVQTVQGQVTEQLIERDGMRIIGAERHPVRISIDTAFARRFSFANIRPAPTWACPSCYTMDFTPLPDQPACTSIEQELMSRMAGTLVVDVRRAMIMRLEGVLTKGFSIKLVGRVYEAEVELTQRLEQGIPVQGLIRTRVRYSKFLGFVKHHELHEITYKDFKLK